MTTALTLKIVSLCHSLRDALVAGRDSRLSTGLNLLQFAVIDICGFGGASLAVLQLPNIRGAPLTKSCFDMARPFVATTCFVTNEVVTHSAGIVPFFYLNISDMGGGGGGVPACTVRIWVHARAWVCFSNPSDGYCRRRNTECAVLSNTVSFKKWCAFGWFYVPYNYSRARRQLA